MKHRLFREERGSISLVSVAMVLSALIMMVVVLERERISYVLRTAQETLDFAAEAGAYDNRVLYTVTVPVTTIHGHWEAGPCTEVDPLNPLVCTAWGDDYFSVDSRPIQDDVREGSWNQLEGVQWRSFFDCDPDGTPVFDGARYCSRPTRTQDRVEFLAGAVPAAEGTFAVNWLGHGLPELTDAGPEATVNDQQRTLRLGATLKLSGVFGLFPVKEIRLEGMAKVMTEPPTLK
jgi:hypothetical protein